MQAETVNTAPTRKPRGSSLELRLLGVPGIRLGAGKPVKLAAKGVGLLAYLALEGRTARRLIATKLWPDSADPLNNLSVARNTISRALGGFDPLEYDADNVWISARFRCDALEWREQLQIETPEVRRASWDAWTGAFLEGFQLSDWDKGLGEEFEEWVLDTRERFDLQRRELAVRLATDALSNADIESALPYLEVVQAGDEPREDATRWLMLCHGALGQPDRASLIYVNLTRLLRDELGVEPTKATHNALEMVRSGRATDCRAALEAEFGARPATTDQTDTLTDVPFVGRSHELEQLNTELARARHGQARLAVILGEPGAGKTRLGQMIAQQVGRDALVVGGTAAPTGLPLVAFDRLARTALHARPDVVRTLGSSPRDALARFLPDLRVAGLHEPTIGPASPEFERRSLFEAIRALVTHPEKPSLIQLDDLQWADQATLDLILHLMHNPPPNGLLVIATQRSTESPLADLHSLLERQAREGLGPRIHLSPLPESDCASLAAHLGRTDTDPVRLHRSTGGNPFYVIEFLRAEPGTAARRVQDLLRARLETLPEIARQSLETLAVLGDGSTLQAMKRVGGRSLEELSDALEQLRRAGLVRFDGDGVAFNHDLTREVILTDLSSPRNALLNLRAARAYRDTPMQAAEHYWASRTVWDDPDTEPAVNAFLETASNVAMRGELETGLNWFERAAKAAPDDALRVRTFTREARVLERYLRYEEALSMLERAERLAENVDVVTRAGVWNARGTLAANAMGDADAAHQLGQRALDALEGLNTPEARIERGNALNNLGYSAWLNRKLDQAEEYHHRALEIRRELGNTNQIATSLLNLGLALRDHDNPNAEQTLTEAIQLWEQTDQLANLARAHNALGYLSGKQARYAVAQQHFERAITLSRSLGEDYVLPDFVNNLGSVLFFQGQYEQARALFAEAASKKASALNDQNRAMFYCNKAEAELCLGLLEEARTSAEAAFGLLHGKASIWWADAHYIRAECAVLENQLETARNEYQAGFEAALVSGNLHRQAVTRSRLATLDLDAELAQQAVNLLDTPVTRAALDAASGHFLSAIKLIQTVSAYEEGRLLVDIARRTGDSKMLEQGFRLLRLSFRAA